MNGLKMDELLKFFPLLKEVHQETIELDRPFEQIAASFAKDIGTVLLLSGSSLDCSRYHILAVKPWLEVCSRQDLISIKYMGKQTLVRQDPFSVIQALLNQFKLNNAFFFSYIHAGDHTIVSTSPERFINPYGFNR